MRRTRRTRAVETPQVNTNNDVIEQQPNRSVDDLVRMLEEEKRERQANFDMLTNLVTKLAETVKQNGENINQATADASSNQICVVDVHDSDAGSRTPFTTPAPSVQVSTNQTEEIASSVPIISLANKNRAKQLDMTPTVLFPSFGGGSDSEVVSYIGHLDKLHDSKVMTERDFLLAIGHNLTGDADHWHRTSGKKHESYTDFRADFLASMLTGNYRFAQENKLRNQLQGPQESFGPLQEYMASIS
jgi:hypothetical protein